LEEDGGVQAASRPHTPVLFSNKMLLLYLHLQHNPGKDAHIYFTLLGDAKTSRYHENTCLTPKFPFLAYNRAVV
jgi:hypothetical protein